MQPQVPKIVVSNVVVKLVNDAGNVKAYASVVINDSIKINGIKVIIDDIGRRKIDFPKAEQFQYVFPLNIETRSILTNKIINRYLVMKQKFENKNENPNENPSEHSVET